MSLHPSGSKDENVNNLRLRTGLVILIFTWLKPCLMVAAPPPAEDITPAYLADLITKGNTLNSIDFETEFEYRYLKPKPADDDSPWDNEKIQALDYFRYVTLDDKLYIRRRSKTPGSGNNYEQINTWSDGVWSHRVTGEQSVGFYAETSAPDLNSHGFLFNMIEGRFPAHNTLAGAIRRGRILECSVDDNKLTCRLAAGGNAAQRARYTIHADLEPRFRLNEYTIELYSPGENKLTERQTYRVLSWQEIKGGYQIPAEAVIDGWSSRNPDPAGTSEGISLHVIYKRLNFRLINKNDTDLSLFETPLPPGTRVYDDRLHLSYEIGDDYLFLDGRLYKLEKPLMEPPGDKLGELLRTAKEQTEVAFDNVSETPVPQTHTLKKEPEKEPLPRVYIVVLLLVTGAAILTGLAINLSHRNKPGRG